MRFKTAKNIQSPVAFYELFKNKEMLKNEADSNKIIGDKAVLEKMRHEANLKRLNTALCLNYDDAEMLVALKNASSKIHSTLRLGLGCN